MTPEQKAREQIDKLLRACGWDVQDYRAFNPAAGRGIALREVPVTGGRCDYLLLVDRKPLGVIEAKKHGATLSSIADQSGYYGDNLPDFLKTRGVLPFLYESTGVETFFRDERDPQPRSRRVFTFHRPETLAAWAAETDTLRTRLAKMPVAHPLATSGMRECQIEAIKRLEESFAADRLRALIQMATGAGKTFTACAFTYRLIKHANAKRVLFLVDRANLGRQAKGEFDQFATPDTGRKFTELYNVQHLMSNQLDSVARVTICTIQRLYSMLRGEELDESVDEASGFEIARAMQRDVASGDAAYRMNVTSGAWNAGSGDLAYREVVGRLPSAGAALVGPVPSPGAESLPVSYNPAIPIETFDFIVTDECHRSIYNLWRQVLEYFDAFLIGLTATPSKQTIGFFNQNLVMEYGHERAVADGVNVGYEVYRIETEVSRQGGLVKKGFYVDKRNKLDRSKRWEQLDEDFTYAAQDIDRSVVVPSQIRTVLTAFKDALFTELFPGRTLVPKTLIFAKDDSHAEDIVHICREVFGKGNDFCKKITYQSVHPETGKPAKSDELIAQFRTSPQLRIAVTVDMIATGTDIKPLECLVFMRDVKSRVYFEQMKGRGTRVLTPTDLQAVSGEDAHAKTQFIIVDAVGVCESDKTDSRPLERQRSVAFKDLLLGVALGKRDEDTLTTLAGRLAKLDRELESKDAEALRQLAGGKSLAELSRSLLDAVNPDVVAEKAVGKPGASPAETTQEKLTAAQKQLIDQACAPFDSPALRDAITRAKQLTEQTIDTVTIDTVTHQGYSADAKAKAEGLVKSFRDYIDQHRAEITALQILYSRPYKQRLTEKMLKDLEAKLKDPFGADPVTTIWRAHELSNMKSQISNQPRRFADLVSLVRFSLQQQPVLKPFAESVHERFNEWLMDKAKGGTTFGPDQLAWLNLIRDHIATAASIDTEDFDYAPFVQRGGLGKAHEVFGEQLPKLLDELNEVLAA